MLITLDTIVWTDCHVNPHQRS